MRVYQIPIAVLCALSTLAPVATHALSTTGVCRGDPPTKTDPPPTYAPEGGNPQNCLALATKVSGGRVCSGDNAGVVCHQHVVQLPLQTFFYIYSATSRLCEESARGYVGVDELDDCHNPPAARR
ncbi:hypothetical protein Msil_3229 [Methylocella silvestris BL2]|uniref:Uncharacterized protein n=1 Tax=Methylocella silvestris (strain DSM 15510 / CIP 108128 / LMG 27833 / NCIMB 13906 / BL2) TaxID=395965 RepID=B8EQC3_METSB|nr:hypothetical protein [Methylocella silvestris]ACK52136.1 hypothetical protein Msil_3229 [Methylocella silvestris BL2]